MRFGFALLRPVHLSGLSLYKHPRWYGVLKRAVVEKKEQPTSCWQGKRTKMSSQQEVRTVCYYHSRAK